jgi:hypothetical protein
MNSRRLAAVSLLLVLAPLYFVSASLLKFGLGVGLLFDSLEAFFSVAQRRYVFNLVSPVVFLGGLALALALDANAVFRIGVGTEGDKVVGAVRLKLRPRNMVVSTASTLLLVALVGYVLLENFTLH